MVPTFCSDTLNAVVKTGELIMDAFFQLVALIIKLLHAFGIPS